MNVRPRSSPGRHHVRVELYTFQRDVTPRVHVREDPQEPRPLLRSASRGGELLVGELDVVLLRLAADEQGVLADVDLAEDLRHLLGVRPVQGRIDRQRDADRQRRRLSS